MLILLAVYMQYDVNASSDCEQFLPCGGMNLLHVRILHISFCSCTLSRREDICCCAARN